MGRVGWGELVGGTRLLWGELTRNRRGNGQHTFTVLTIGSLLLLLRLLYASYTSTTTRVQNCIILGANMTDWPLVSSGLTVVDKGGTSGWSTLYAVSTYWVSGPVYKSGTCHVNSKFLASTTRTWGAQMFAGAAVSHAEKKTLSFIPMSHVLKTDAMKSIPVSGADFSCHMLLEWNFLPPKATYTMNS